MYEHPSPLISQIFLRFSSGLRNRVLLAGLLSLLGGSVGAERHYVGLTACRHPPRSGSLAVGLGGGPRRAKSGSKRTRNNVGLDGV